MASIRFLLNLLWKSLKTDISSIASTPQECRTAYVRFLRKVVDLNQIIMQEPRDDNSSWETDILVLAEELGLRGVVILGIAERMNKREDESLKNFDVTLYDYWNN